MCVCIYIFIYIYILTIPNKPYDVTVIQSRIITLNKK